MAQYGALKHSNTNKGSATFNKQKNIRTQILEHREK